MRLDLLVSRRGIDPSAETCEEALRHLMHEPVSKVECGELWRFEVRSGDTSSMRERLQRAACRAGRYVNLNRDVCAWLDGPPPASSAAPADAWAADVWVCDDDGRDPAALAYYRRQGCDALQDLRRGILWRLWLAEPDAAAARQRALHITVTRARPDGLLLNPHAQTAELLHVCGGPATKENR